VHLDKDISKERKNVSKHGFDFSFADHMLSDPMAVVVFDRWENGEERWHNFAMIGDMLLLLVFSYPDPEDEEWIRIIGVRKADKNERNRYEDHKSS
jgi:uncharacterized DUF497 family protein